MSRPIETPHTPPLLPSFYPQLPRGLELGAELGAPRRAPGRPWAHVPRGVACRRMGSSDYWGTREMTMRRYTRPYVASRMSVEQGDVLFSAATVPSG